MEDIGTTMDHLQLPHKLRSRINRYYWYCWFRYSNFTNKGVSSFLGELSEPLAMEVQLICHSNLLANIPLFAGANSNVMRHVMMSIDSEIFLPGDYIFRVGDEAVKLYMIQVREPPRLPIFARSEASTKEGGRWSRERSERVSEASVREAGCSSARPLHPPARSTRSLHPFAREHKRRRALAP
jgi:hypothetical protein